MMAGGIKETDPEKLAANCCLFMQGAQRDMWLFELYHHLNDCTDALRALAREKVHS